MNIQKKDILELKKRLKKDHCTFTKMCGCYVNSEKKILLKFRETFLNLDDDEFHKYIAIAKKTLSGTIGNNILELNFPINEDYLNEKQISLMELKNSKLKDDSILDKFYQSIINNYTYTGNILILVFHDAYDVITKTTDNLNLDESEEVYEYILCAICPVSLSEPGLRYYEDENKITSRVRDWVVDFPTHGFIFPAFINRSSDVNSLMYYTKNPKDSHTELMENALGCSPKQTATIQKNIFETIIKDSLGDSEKKSEKLFMEIQENLNFMIEEHNSTYMDVIEEPMVLSKNDMQNLLLDSGVSEDDANKIEKSYEEYFSCDLPLAENLIDAKTLKASAQKRKEKYLEGQVEKLQTQLNQVKQETLDNLSLIKDKNQLQEYTDNIINKSENSNLDANNEDLDETITTNSFNENNNIYDIILQVKPEKINQIKSQIIDGQKCIVIPINDNEQTNVNGLDNLI